MKNLDQLCVDTLRFLSVDQVEAARSGHPGMPLGAAPMAYALFDRFLRHNPAEPKWFDRDRFILSAGHGSALLYSVLHMTGYDVPLEELKRFRQWGSKTPGHPEYGHVPGVEATTGPLGQGFAMGVGMAVAEAHLAALFNRPGFQVVDHHTYAIVSDGDLMEGIASEAASLAGHLKLGKIVYLYDDNKISIEGSTGIAFTEDVGQRFEAYAWHVQRVEDGNDLETISEAIRAARAETERPSLILVRTHIGYGSPKQDSADAHGAPLGPEATRTTKAAAGWPLEPPFVVPDEARAHMRQALERGVGQQKEWEALLAAYAQAHPELAASFLRTIKGERPDGWDAGIPAFKASDPPVATRSVSGKIINALAKTLPTLAGGSADLAPSNNTLISGSPDFSREHREGRNLRFGVREQAMAAAVNGMALHGGVIPYGATFLIFSDYCRASLRLAALMKVPSIFVFTHDSVGVGEDGPTHQPVEQLMSLRVIPGLLVLRPADASETAEAWRLVLTLKRPAVLALTRQNLPILDPEKYPIRQGVPKGAYILAEAKGSKPDVVLVATGSEVQLALGARAKLFEQGVKARVVSMPSWLLFDEQPEAYRTEVLPPDVPTLAVEAGSTRGWRDYADDVLGLDHFGASAPGSEVFKQFGFTVENVVDRALNLLRK
jgi:transketolase